MFIFLAFPSMTTRTSWWRTFVRWPRPRSSWSFRAESINGKVNSFLNFLDCNIFCNCHYHFFTIPARPFFWAPFWTCWVWLWVWRKGARPMSFSLLTAWRVQHFLKNRHIESYQNALAKKYHSWLKSKDLIFNSKFAECT